MSLNKKYEQDLKENRFIGAWDGIYNDMTDILMEFYMNNKTNSARYKSLMEWNRSFDINLKKNMIAFYYNIDKKYYHYAMKKLLSEEKLKTNEKVAVKSGYYFEIFSKEEIPNSLKKSNIKVELNSNIYDLYKGTSIEDEKKIDLMFGDRMGYDIDEHTVKKKNQSVKNLNRRNIILEEKNTKPKCALIGQDGNIFNLMGIASRTLRRNGMQEQAQEMISKITNTAKSYDDALAILGDYVDIVSEDELNEENTEEEFE